MNKTEFMNEHKKNSIFRDPKYLAAINTVSNKLNISNEILSIIMNLHDNEHMRNVTTGLISNIEHDNLSNLDKYNTQITFINKMYNKYKQSGNTTNFEDLSEDEILTIIGDDNELMDLYNKTNNIIETTLSNIDHGLSDDSSSYSINDLD